VAAITYPEVAPTEDRHRPELRLVPPARRRSSRQRAVYRRRRAVVLVGLVAMVVLARIVVGAAVGASGSAAGGPEIETTPVSAEVVVVQPGETYWSIAQALGGSGDIRERVDALVAANGGAFLEVGDRVVVPPRAVPPR
jgi:hypothetical protein